MMLKYNEKQFRSVAWVPREVVAIAQKIHDEWLQKQPMIVTGVCWVETNKGTIKRQELVSFDKARLVVIEKVDKIDADTSEPEHLGKRYTLRKCCESIDGVKWNPYNKVVQCHRCGHEWLPKTYVEKGK